MPRYAATATLLRRCIYCGAGSLLGNFLGFRDRWLLYARTGHPKFSLRRRLQAWDLLTGEKTRRFRFRQEATVLAMHERHANVYAFELKRMKYGLLTMAHQGRFLVPSFLIPKFKVEKMEMISQQSHPKRVLPYHKLL